MLRRVGSLVWLLAVAACVTLSARDLRPTHRSDAIEDAGEPIGAEECVACHEDVLGRAPAPAYHADCESCHGAGETHWESEEPADIRFPANADCVACHETGHRTLMTWTRSDHERAGVYCTDCHATHDREPWNLRHADAVSRAVTPRASEVTRMCGDCHPEVTSSFALPSHHPLREGMIDCTDCHAPHGSARTALGVATDRCTGCHQDYAGPWIHEHAPVAEDCTSCHAPHGASSRALLETNEPGVCISCHSLAESGAVHDPFAFATRCTDCHGAVHGSYSDPHLRH